MLDAAKLLEHDHDFLPMAKIGVFFVILSLFDSA